VNPVIAPDNNRHPPPLEVERHLVNLLKPRTDLEAVLELGVLQYRDVEQVLEAGLVKAVQVSIFEDVVGFAASDIKVTLGG